MFIELPELPYQTNALEPYISERTVLLHYSKHHAGYVNNLNQLIKGSLYDKMDLTGIIKASAGTPVDIAIFNNAGQVYNHNIYWLSMSPNKADHQQSPLLKQLIERDFGSLQDCIENLSKLAVGRFGSGWAWLCFDPSQSRLQLTSTQNAQTPITDGLVPLLTIDVWEHAYYLDYQNLRAKYIEIFFDALANWSFASDELSKVYKE